MAKNLYVVQGDDTWNYTIKKYRYNSNILELFEKDEIHDTYEIAKIYMLKKLDYSKQAIEKVINSLELLTEVEFFTEDVPINKE